MKTPLRFLKKTALAAIFAASATSVCAATSATQPRLDWFSEDVSSYTALTDADGSWTAAAGDYEITGNRLVIDSEGVTYAPDSSSSENEAVLTLNIAFPAAASLPSTSMTDAQTAITVAVDNNVTNYYVYAGTGAAGTSPDWTAVTAQGVAAPVADTPVAVEIKIDYTAGKAYYTIGGINAGEYYLAKASATSVADLLFAGSGSIGNFSGAQGIATHTLGGVNASYASNAAALAAAIAQGKALETWSGNANDGWTTTSAGSGTSAAPFLIRTVADLNDLATIVQSTNCAGIVFQQANDIDFDGAAAFDGIGTYSRVFSGSSEFAGTYNGNGNKILNVEFSDVSGSSKNNYRGVFNQVSGTIANLTVSNITFAATSGEFGGSIVGNAGRGATLQNVIAEGSFCSDDKPGTHNMAGIVVRASGQGSGVTIQNCTNNATIYGAYTKVAGICTLTQRERDTNNPPADSEGRIVFDGCANNGDIVAKTGSTAGRDGVAGIVAYTADGTYLKDCSNKGTLSSTLSSAKIGELIAYHQSLHITDQGGNSAPANKKMIDTQIPANITGFQYATIDNGVATTIAPPYTLAKDTPYLLEGNVAESETPVFTLAAAGDTIAFDTALGYTFAGTVTAAQGLDVSSSTSGTVTTYTAAAHKYPAVFLR